MPDARRQQVESIIGRSLLTAETLSGELRRRLVTEITQLRGSLSDHELLNIARNLLSDFEPIAVQAMTDAELAAWVSGVDVVEKRLPALARDALAPVLAAASVPPGTPGGGLTAFVAGAGDESVIRFPLIERAAESLMERDIVTRADFDQLTREARARAFTVARLDTQDAIATVRDTLAETIEEGASLGRFRAKLKENLAGSRLGPAHIENVYRTNIQAAFHQGHDELADNPIVAEVFPYQEYLPIGDSRTRPEHLALAELGINETGVYRRDDPFWDLFLPPWDFQSVLPGQVVSARNVQLAFRGFYEGTSIEFETDSGNTVRVTSNHGVMTDQGVMPARLLQDGMNVFGHKDRIQGDRPILSENINDEPTAIEEVFSSLAKSSAFCRAPASSLDFHGDGQGFKDGNVDAVGPMLTQWHWIVYLNAIYAKLQQGRVNSHIVSGNSSAGSIDVLHHDLALGLRDLCPAKFYGFGPIARCDTSIYESHPDDVPGDAEFFCDGTFSHPLFVQPRNRSVVGFDPNTTRALRSLSLRSEPWTLTKPTTYRTIGNPEFTSQLLHRHAGSIKLHKVTRVREFDFCGHVYDLQTSTGWMSINNTILRQCRCGVNLLTVEAAGRKGVVEARQWDRTGQPPINPEFRLDSIPFRPDPGFVGGRARSTVGF